MVVILCDYEYTSYDINVRVYSPKPPEIPARAGILFFYKALKPLKEVYEKEFREKNILLRK